MSLDILQLVLITIVTAATPLALAAVGELVVERSGVLNLGVEGMMIMGAAAGFATAYSADSTLAGIVAAVGAGMLMAALFAFLAIGLAINQVASGLALTILGVGLADLVGSGFVGQKRNPVPTIHIPGLSDIPFVGRLVFGEDCFVYLTIVLVAAVAYFLRRTRSGLTLRAIGDNHGSAHALGVPVRRDRALAVLFGGACAGLAGGYLSLVSTPFWAPDMTAGRGWIALALVVFASWRPWRVVWGALLFGGATELELHAQAFGVGLPSQLLSSVPYLATVVALIVLSIGNRRGAAAPAALGTPFVPDR
jgi:ABC-type uncharacterized transport system permease subunit